MSVSTDYSGRPVIRGKRTGRSAVLCALLSGAGVALLSSFSECSQLPQYDSKEILSLASSCHKAPEGRAESFGVSASPGSATFLSRNMSKQLLAKASVDSDLRLDEPIATTPLAVTATPAFLAGSANESADSLLADSTGDTTLSAPEDSVSDTTTDTTIDTTTDTTAIVSDSLAGPTAPDSSAILAARAIDSVTAIRLSDTIPSVKPFRFSEYAAALALGAQRDLRRSIDKSYYHDAGDFFRADRSFFTVDYLTTPARHTVTAFGLPGPRVTPIFDGRPLTPLEHMPEQDALYDFNDVPTSSVSDVYTLKGPLAAFLGGESGIGGLWLQKLRTDGPRAESRLEAQKGPFSYAYTKGMISETLPNGFSYTAALGFRKTSFFSLLANDDASHQFWEIEAPYRKNWRITTSVRLYRREADITYKPQSLSVQFNRDRRDRDILARLERVSGDDNSVALEFRHQRSESGSRVLLGAYSQRLDRIDNSFTAIWNHRGTTSMMALTLRGAREKLQFDQGANERNHGIASLKAMLRLSGESFTDVELPVSTVHPTRNRELREGFQNAQQTSFIFGEIAVAGAGGYAVQPRASFGYISLSPGRSLSLALGVTPVFPRQYELDLPLESPVVSSITESLQQSGNGELVPEEQYTASAEARFGSADKQLTLSVTGGKVVDGINWRTSPTSIGLQYRPLNEDFTFVGVTASQRYPVTSWLAWNGSASLYSSAYDSTAQPTYAPDYNLFSGLALDFYFRPLDMYVSGYGEVTLVGKYTGNDGSQLGRQGVVNLRVAIRIKDFKFHYVFENSLNAQFQAREQYTNIGRYSWYWITWNFFN